MPLQFRPHYDKIIELLLYLAHVRPGLDKYQVVKLFYLADREHLNRYGRPITYERYCALQYGPVASNAKDFLEGNKFAMAKINNKQLPFRTETRKDEKGRDLLYLQEPLREVDFDTFSKSDLRVIDEIIERYGQLNFDELYNLTHEHYAYKNAWRNRRWFAKQADMHYEDMVEDDAKRAELLDDIGSIAAHMQ
jgi:uncharacterized phage-associated protein